MTDLMTHHPDDTGETRAVGEQTVNLVGEQRTSVIRPPAGLLPPAADVGGATRRLKPMTVLVPLVPRRPRVDPTAPVRFIAPAAIPTGAEMAVGARSGCQPIDPDNGDFTTAPTPPTRPLPTPPPEPAPPAKSAGRVGRHRAPSALDRLIGRMRGAR